jgi:hypothetical protein
MVPGFGAWLKDLASPGKCRRARHFPLPHRLLERLLTLVVPLLTIGMGMVVAGLIGSALIGLLSINDLAF